MACGTAGALGAGEKQKRGGGGQTRPWCALTLLAPLVGPPQHSAVKGRDMQEFVTSGHMEFIGSD
eukprot:CAMPEP_0174379358 /NCGR_PEP_ID=MMETSP0811_2-20130205/122658_1 /TAXON_ID=73025 ORGANISM="Eutreptiella gymnastica-like, Strain CCMP1594" /NCGR_SAMPLE_ID=MMETSP0811_2 /ASSEMBLY_ACC=CAM_ASM_000667 /LENGTH=64 /DNA_ID=CAMNT_0015531869 /DNA_START=409 /DNA_END=603 /DNA_ORIENTATION=-